MSIRLFVPCLLLIATACNSILDTHPSTTIPEQTAISDSASAQAAVIGMYSALQSTASYGREFLEFGDLSADNADNTGSFTSYLEADRNDLHSNNSTVFDLWTSAYDGINRANEIIAKVGPLTGFDATAKAEFMGEAYFVRALEYHNLVKLYGGVPIKLTPTTSVSDIGNVTRNSVADVYTQINKDLDSATAFVTNTEPATQATVGGVAALRARVYLYQGDYANAILAANTVEGLGFDLASNYGDLFPSTPGSSTVEDLFKIDAALTQENFISYDYLSVYELAPSVALMTAYDPALDPDDLDTFETTDVRGQWNILVDDGDPFGNKFRSIVGTDPIPVLRFAEVLLIRSEAQARQNHLPEAVADLNRVRARASATLFVLGTHTAADIIQAVSDERQKELAFEGDRWPDLVRLGTAASVLGIQFRRARLRSLQRSRRTRGTELGML
jgi:starch-binding outer membrane protein, SusD/RagB family